MFEGDGEGGEVGGRGRIEASSSASACIEGDHTESEPSDNERDRTLVPPPTLFSASASPAVTPLRLFRLLDGPTERECDAPR